MSTHWLICIVYMLSKYIKRKQGRKEGGRERGRVGNKEGERWESKKDIHKLLIQYTVKISWFNMIYNWFRQNIRLHRLSSVLQLSTVTLLPHLCFCNLTGLFRKMSSTEPPFPIPPLQVLGHFIICETD